MKNPVHILRYGTVADKEVLYKSIDTFNWLAINGSTAAYVSKSISKFIVNNFFNSPDKGYFIDPLTYAFQGNINLLYSGKENKMKASMKALINKYQGVIRDRIESREVVIPSDFKDELTTRNLCKNVLDFQYRLVDCYIQDSELMDYLGYASDLRDIDRKIRPRFLLAPYFYLNDNSTEVMDWLDVNIRMLAYAEEITSDYDIPVYAQVVISKSVLENPEIIEAIADAYRKADPKGITLWIDGFSEHEASIGQLEGMVYLLEKLAPIPVYNMYGGYFSILLTNKQVGLLQGVSHGLEYGEYRQVYPVGGGLPVSKYYYLPLHRRVGFYNAFTLLSENGYIDVTDENWGNSRSYYSDICDCEECHKLLNGSMVNFSAFDSNEFYVTHIKGKEIRRSKASKTTKNLCRYHYMNCKAKEFDDCCSKSLKTLLHDLQETHRRYSTLQSYILGDYNYIENWIKVISEIKGDSNGK